MKLLFCPDCDTIFKLTLTLRSCECGKVKGKYLENRSHAVVNGNGYSLAIGNGSFVSALSRVNQGVVASDWRDDSTWVNWWALRPKDSGLFLAWARPHTDAANSHTTIQPDL